MNYSCCLLFCVIVLVSLHSTDGSWIASLQESLFGRKNKSRETIDRNTTASSLTFLQSSIQDTKRLISEGHLAASLESILSLVETHSDSHECNALLGELLLGMKKHDLASKFLYSAAQLSNWTDAFSVANLAFSLLSTEEGLNSSLKVLQKGLDSAINEEQSILLRQATGDVLYSVGNYHSAADWYLSAALIGQNDTALWLKASTLQFPVEGRDYQFARNVLLKAIESHKTSSRLFMHLGEAVHMSGEGDVDQAIALWAHAVSLDETDVAAAVALADGLFSRGRLFDALAQYERAMKLDPSNAAVLYSCASLLSSLGRTEQSDAVANRALELSRGSKEHVVA